MKLKELKQFIREIALEEIKSKKVLKEYFFAEDSTIADLTMFNLFGDMLGWDGGVDLGLAIDGGEFAADAEWMKKTADIIKKYRPVAFELLKKMKKVWDEPIPNDTLDDGLDSFGPISGLDSYIYVGSDMYDDADIYIEHMPGMFDNQIEIIEIALSILGA